MGSVISMTAAAVAFITTALIMCHTAAANPLVSQHSQATSNVRSACNRLLAFCSPHAEMCLSNQQPGNTFAAQLV